MCVRCLGVNVDKSNVIVIDKERLHCIIMMDGRHLEQISEFKYYAICWLKQGTDDVECS